MSEQSPGSESGWMMVAVRPAGRRVVVVGSGQVARRRAELFVSRGAMVEVYDPALSEEALLPDGVACYREEISREAIGGAWLVIVATSDLAVNRQVGQWCDDLGIACNRADDADEGTFAVPAMMEDELGWKLGILGGEAGPLFSVWLKGLVGEATNSDQVERVYTALADARHKLEDTELTQQQRAAKLRAVMSEALKEPQLKVEG